MRDLDGIVMDPDEREVAVLGEKYLQEYAEYGISEKAFCVATDRRVYVFGECRRALGGAYVKDEGDCTIPLKSITATGITQARFPGSVPRSFLKVAAWNLATFLVVMLVDYVGKFRFGARDIALTCAAFGFPALIALSVYEYSERFELFVLEYAGGKIGLSLYDYPRKEVRNFERRLHGVMDRRDGAEPGGGEGPEEPVAGRGACREEITEDLRECSDMRTSADSSEEEQLNASQIPVGSV